MNKKQNDDLFDDLFDEKKEIQMVRSDRWYGDVRKRFLTLKTCSFNPTMAEIFYFHLDIFGDCLKMNELIYEADQLVQYALQSLDVKSIIDTFLAEQNRSETDINIHRIMSKVRAGEPITEPMNDDVNNFLDHLEFTARDLLRVRNVIIELMNKPTGTCDNAAKPD